MSFTFEELKEAIVREYDVDLVCEILQVSVEDLLDAFEDKLIIHREKFDEENLREY
jgi:hypothetical protein|tara:strand:+ start:161 stop:328 length:168 start_codon:yes stop_codon:yes gene_type:complete